MSEKIYISKCLAEEFADVCKLVNICGYEAVKAPYNVSITCSGGIIVPAIGPTANRIIKTEVFNEMSNCEAAIIPRSDKVVTPEILSWETTLADQLHLRKITKNDLLGKLEHIVLDFNDCILSAAAKAGVIFKFTEKEGKCQEDYVIEECSELLKEIVKKKRDKGDDDKIVEEFVDVIVTMIPIILNMERDITVSDILKLIDEKQTRCIKRYEESKEL